MKKIEMLEGNNTKVEYDKIQTIKDQYCFIKVEIKELDNGEIVKQEVVECGLMVERHMTDLVIGSCSINSTIEICLHLLL